MARQERNSEERVSPQRSRMYRKSLRPVFTDDYGYIYEKHEVGIAEDGAYIPITEGRVEYWPEPHDCASLRVHAKQSVPRHKTPVYVSEPSPPRHARDRVTRLPTPPTRLVQQVVNVRTPTMSGRKTQEVGCGEICEREIHIWNIHFSATSRELWTFIQKTCGYVERCTVIRDERNGRSKGHGFVEFRDKKSADFAINKANGINFKGRPLKIEPKIKLPENRWRASGPRRAHAQY